MERAIGGYFELELSCTGDHYHRNAIKLNTARCAFEYILRVKSYRKVYIPYYTCDVMMQPIARLGIEYEFYRINEQLEPVFDGNMAENEAFLYTNYYGVKQDAVKRIAERYKNVIIDNSQAFFAPALKGIDTFYSARKFFGVSDGAYLYTDKILDVELEQDVSCDRMSHLLKRFELGAQVGYADFCTNDCSLGGQPIKLMSKLTETLLKTIDYERAYEIRKGNFEYLQNTLYSMNKLLIHGSYPAMVYPYWSDQVELRSQLINCNIFVAKYWTNVEQWVKDGVEIELMNNLIPLPIDQRYNKVDIEYMVKTIQ